MDIAKTECEVEVSPLVCCEFHSCLCCHSIVASDSDVVVSTTYVTDDFTEEESELTDDYLTDDCLTYVSDHESSCDSDDSIYFSDDTRDDDQSLDSLTMDNESDTLEEGEMSEDEDVFDLFQACPSVIVENVFHQDVSHMLSHHEDDYLKGCFQYYLTTAQC